MRKDKLRPGCGLEKAVDEGSADRLKDAMEKLSAAAGLPVQKVVDKDTDESEQLLKARQSTARALGIHSFRRDSAIVPRGPWVTRVFTQSPPVEKTVRSNVAKSNLRAEVDRLMATEREKQLQLRQELKDLLNK